MDKELNNDKKAGTKPMLATRSVGVKKPKLSIKDPNIRKTRICKLNTKPQLSCNCCYAFGFSFKNNINQLKQIK